MIHKLVPLMIRRDIVLLGIFHKCILVTCHSYFDDRFPFVPLSTNGESYYGYDPQLENFRDESVNRDTLWKRYIFALIHISSPPNTLWISPMCQNSKVH